MNDHDSLQIHDGRWLYRIKMTDDFRSFAMNGIELDRMVRDSLSRGFHPLVEVLHEAKLKPTRISG